MLTERRSANINHFSLIYYAIAVNVSIILYVTTECICSLVVVYHHRGILVSIDNGLLNEIEA